MQDLISKAATLLEALPYIQKFSGETFVVKYGGSFMDSPDASIRNGVARDIVFLEAVEINPVVVHGGGKAITRAMEKAGLVANFIQGQRVTDEATVQIVDDVLSREINPEVVKTINALGGQAVGFSGADIFKCKKLFLDDKENPGRKIDIGYVGEVIEVNVAPLKECIWCGHTPVISPTARGEDGKIYNCNADIAAAMCAIALNAKRLVFMSDVPGPHEFGGIAVTAAWPLPDPAKFHGSAIERAAMLNELYASLRRRIEIFTALPFASLDRMALKARLRKTPLPAGRRRLGR